MKIFCKKTINIRQHLRSQISRSYFYLKPGNTFLSTLLVLTYPTSYSRFQLMSSHAKNIYIEIAAVCRSSL